MNIPASVPGPVAALAAGGALQMFVVQVLAFGLLAWILWKFVRPLLGKILDQRSRSIEETFQKMERDTAEAARQTADLKEKLSRIDEEARRRTDAALEEARRSREQLLAESRAQVQAAIDKARMEIQFEREKAILELREQASDLTLRAAGQLIDSAMTDALHDGLVEKTLTRLEAMKKP